MSTFSDVVAGGATGASIGTSIMPGIGTAIGAVGGALVGGLKNVGSGKQAYKRYVKQQFKNLMEKGTTLSDQERRAIDRNLVDAQAQTQAAQDIGRQRSALAQTGGSPILAGQQRKTAKEAGEANRDIAVKASSQGAKMAAALDERRKAGILQRMGLIAEQEDAQGQQDRNMALGMADAVSEISKLT
tara:strand:- start:5649 stop:6209 length:561 start_codon:yes stop_codon:yes gene_type:complete